MILWVTTVILSSFLKTNCPAKPHSYRLVCSEDNTELTQNNSWRIFISSAYCNFLAQHRASGRLECYSFSWHDLPGEQWGSAWQLTFINPLPLPDCIWERSASVSSWSLAPDSPKMLHCCFSMVPVQPPNAVSCMLLSNHKPWKYFISSCRMLSLWTAYPS